MKNEDHRLAAEDDEATIPVLTASAIGDRGNRMIIEGYFGSAFHWIAYKCDLAYGKHKNNHTKLVSFLNDVGEQEIAERWRVLEEIRNGSFYGHRHTSNDVAEAERLWKEIKAWAT